MKYDPNATVTTLPDDWYELSIERAEETVSKKDNPMMKVTFRIYAESRPPPIFMYFIPSVPGSLTQFKKLCKAVGVDFDAGEVTPEMLQGQSLEGFLKTQKDDDYGDKNVVAQYRAIGTGTAVAATVQAAPNEEAPKTSDDIPF